jgi:hypothetical protein
LIEPLFDRLSALVSEFSVFTRVNADLKHAAIRIGGRLGESAALAIVAALSAPSPIQSKND